MLALLCMWLGISVPLVFIGYFFGFRKQVLAVILLHISPAADASVSQPFDYLA